MTSLRNLIKWSIALFLAFAFAYVTVDTVQAAGVPGQQAAPTAVAGNKQATVTWTAPLDGGSAITSYTVTSTPGSKTCTASGASATSCIVTGLTNGVTYTFNVAASNLLGSGPASPESKAVTPIHTSLVASGAGGEGFVVKSLFTTDGAKAFYVVDNAATSNSTLVMDYLLTDQASERMTFETWERISTLVLDANNSNLYFSTTKSDRSVAGSVSYNYRTFRLATGSFTIEAQTAFGTGQGYSQLKIVPGRGYLLGLSRYSQWFKKLDLTTLAQVGATSAELWDSNVGLAVDSNGQYAYYLQWINLSNSPSCMRRLDIVAWRIGATGTSGCLGRGLYVDRVFLNSAGNPVAIFTKGLTEFSATTLAGARSMTTTFTIKTAEQLPGTKYIAVTHQYALNTSTPPTYGVSIFDIDSMALVQTIDLGTTFIPSEIAVTADNKLRVFQADATGIYRDIYITDVADKPTSVTGVFGDSSASVSWTAPTYKGSSDISSYKVVSSPEGKTCTSSNTSCVVEGLTNGTSYTFAVYAYNDQGESPISISSAAVIPATVPDAPTGAASSIGADKAIRVSWTAPADNGGSVITGYRVESVDTSDTCSVVGGTPTYCTVSNLTVGQTYSFKVYATNKAGEGVASEATPGFIPVTKPGAPTGVSATYGSASATVSWTAPEYDGGTALVRHLAISLTSSATCTDITSCVTQSQGGCFVNSPGNSCQITGLVNGSSYRFVVLAYNVTGYGLASARSDTVTPKTVPGAPTSVTATRGDASATISWTAPTSNGGAAITGYTVSSTPEGATCSATTLTTCTISGLTNGTSYTFKVTATNSEGDSPLSVASAAVTPNVVPLAPSNVTVVHGNAQVTVSWTAPESNGGTAVTLYMALASTGSLYCTAAANQNSCTVTGLTNGTSYTFRVKATNALGYGPLSAASSAVTPKTVPGAPTGVSGGTRDQAVYVQWTAPTVTGGAAITGYTVTATPGGATCSTTGATNCTVTGLTNGTSYTFRVVATNSEGNSLASTASASVMANVAPAAPTNVLVSYGNAYVDVSWTSPTSNGGTAITSYYVESAPVVKTCTSTSSVLSCRVSGLTNGTTYTFKVRGVNLAGNGTFSSNSDPIVPRTKPGAPSFSTATRGNGSYAFTIGAPASNGGAVITSYDVTSSPGGGSCSASPSSSSCSISGLTNGSTYTFSVTATNSEGTSPSTSFTGVPDVVPNSPNSVSAQYSNATALVAWTAPDSNGGTSLLSYKVTSSPGAKTCTVTAPTTTCSVTGLTNGTSYTFSVQAVNAAGLSLSSSASTAVIPRLVPPAVTDATATAQDGAVLIEWVAPSGINAAAVTYNVVSNPGGATCTSNGTSCLVERLANGSAYTFIITPTYNAGGVGTSVSTISVSPGAIPDEPTNVQATGGYLSAVVNWLAPADTGGLPLTAYLVTSTPGDRTCAVSAPATSCTVTGLTDGIRYTFTVQARNAKGYGPESAASESVLVGETPDAPNSIYGIAGSNQVSVFWSAPLNTGGLDVTQYVATSTPGGFICVTSTATKCVIGGLVNGVSYTFTVRAYTDFGPSAESIASSAVKPANKNNQPSDISSMFLSSTELRVVWNKVTSSGLPVNSYLVELTEPVFPYDTLESTSVTADQLTYVFTDLIPNYGYLIRVTALDINLDELGVLSLNDENSPLPAMYEASSITGTTLVSSVLTSNFGSWMGLPVPTITRQWYACSSEHESTTVLPADCVAISKATAATFVATASQINKYLMVGVTAKNTVGSVVNFGATTPTVVGAAPKLGTAPKTAYPTKITSPAALTAATGVWTGGPTPDIAVQWQKCTVATKATIASLTSCTDIDGATGSSYTTTSDVVGKFIRYVITATNEFGSAVYYAASTTIVLQGPTVTVSPSVYGTMNVGQSILAIPGQWTGAPGFKYAWYRCSGEVTESLTSVPSGCVAISKATKMQYTVVSADFNKYLLVQITATNTAGSVYQYSPARRVTAP